MKKAAIYIVNLINRLTNNQTTTREDATTILSLFFLKKNTRRTLETFEILEALFAEEMKARRSAANCTSRLITDKYPSYSKVSTLMVNDPIFNEPIKNN